DNPLSVHGHLKANRNAGIPSERRYNLRKHTSIINRCAILTGETGMESPKLQNTFLAVFFGRRLGALLLLAVTGVGLLSGCARSTVNTTVRADGSWTRMVIYRAPAPDDKGLSLGP